MRYGYYWLSGLFKAAQDFLQGLINRGTSTSPLRPLGQVEDHELNPQSSSEGHSGSHGGVDDSDSDDLLGEELAIFSPPTTRSHALVSSTVENTPKVPLQPVPPMLGPDMVPGTSSSKKKPKKRKPRKSQK
ncbi:hypothetical protein NL676_014375 [Syzygium grande]|nr:hypothetical protein NL676_014375 [Syzygium grande]